MDGTVASAPRDGRGTIIPRLLSVDDLLKGQTALKKQRIYTAVAAGLLPCVRIGRSLFFTEAAIADFIERGGQPLPGGWRRELPQVVEPAPRSTPRRSTRRGRR